MADKKRVLFLCTGNSARSQMAEGLLRHLAGDRYDVFSAGTAPKGLHPRTVDVMKDIGIDVSRQRSKDVQEFQGQKFDYVIQSAMVRNRIARFSQEHSRSIGDSTIRQKRPLKISQGCSQR